MAEKVKISLKLDLDHELGADHFQTWLSQLEIAFALHGVTDSKKQYLAAAFNLGENAAHYLWQRYPQVPGGSTPYDDFKALFTEYFGGTKSDSARLAALFAISQRNESTQAFRHRVQKDMRSCGLTTSAKVDNIVEAVGVHLFARGLNSASARQRVLETGDKTIGDAAARAQAVVLSENRKFCLLALMCASLRRESSQASALL